MSTLNSISIRTRLLGLLIASALLTLVVGVFGVTRTAEVNDMLNAMYDDNLVPVADIANANMQAIYHNRSLYDLVIEPDAQAMDRIAERMDGHIAKLNQLLGAYRKTALTPAEAELLGKFDAAWPAYLDSAARIAAFGRANQHDEAMKVMNSETVPAFQLADDLLSDLVDANVARAKQAHDAGDAVATHSRRLTIAVVLAAIGLSVGLGLLVARSITGPLGGEPSEVAAIADAIAACDLTRPVPVRPGDQTSVIARMAAMQASLTNVVGEVRRSSDSIATGSAQIATGNADLSQRTEEQASNLQETSASMEQLTSTVRNNADTAREANALAASASAAAASGGQVVGRVVATMQDIAASSNKIAEIIEVIDGIAFQTNILALNAAVEAARAGEQGRGFAVVAGEVRSLAQRSAHAAKDIKALIDDSVGKVEAGSQQAIEAGASMQEIVGQVKRVSDLISEISNATAEQSIGIGQVGDAVGQLDSVTQQNAALVEESAAAAESLRVQAGKLNDMVGVFKLGTAHVGEAVA